MIGGADSRWSEVRDVIYQGPCRSESIFSELVSVFTRDVSSGTSCPLLPRFVLLNIKERTGIKCWHHMMYPL